MTPGEIGTWLAKSLGDFHLSRGERQELADKIAALESLADRQTVLRLAFELARASLDHPQAQLILGWLEDVARTIGTTHSEPTKTLAEAYFSPGDECLDAILRLLHHSRRTANICVFTITDNRVSGAILDAHRRNVSVRIVTDNEKAEDLGSDVERFEAAGIPVRVDRSPFHMHHKFAILDGKTLVTGSYNWTRGAARDNQENLIVTNDLRLVKPFSDTFDHLWNQLG
jgi:phosphatidylserine/phosphatidylglycerophosphate/cardiolipin synthase-like enzyme